MGPGWVPAKFFQLFYRFLRIIKPKKQKDRKQRCLRKVDLCHNNIDNPSLTRLDICQKCVSWADIDDGTSLKESTLYALYKEL